MMPVVADTGFTWNAVLVDGNWIHYRAGGRSTRPR